MRKELIISSRMVSTMFFKTLKAAVKYQSLNGGEMVYYRAHEYYISIC